MLVRKCLAILFSATLIVNLFVVLAFAENLNDSYQEALNGIDSAEMRGQNTEAEFDYDYDEEPEELIDFESRQGELTAEQAERMDDFIKEFERQLVFDEDGISTENVDLEYFEEKYGEEIVILSETNIESINEEIEEGALELTESGTIYDPEDENYYIQGKYNKNKSTTYWWGRKIFQSYSNANKHKNSLKAIAKTSERIGEILTIIGGFAGTGGLVFIPDQIFALGINHYCKYFCRRIEECNKKGIGIKYKIYWTCNYTMRSQDEKW